MTAATGATRRALRWYALMRDLVRSRGVPRADPRTARAARSRRVAEASLSGPAMSLRSAVVIRDATPTLRRAARRRAGRHRRARAHPARRRPQSRARGPGRRARGAAERALGAREGRGPERP